MKKFICDFLLVAMICFIASSCTYSESAYNCEPKEVINHSFTDINSVLTNIPVFENAEGVYYADGGTTLTKFTEDCVLTIDSCEDDALIQNIYVGENYIYYEEHNFSQTNIERINKDNLNDKQTLLTVSRNPFSVERDFIYEKGDIVYYYDDYDNVLYMIINNQIQEIKGITSAVIYGDYMYYADALGDLYKSTYDGSDSQKMWSLETLRMSENEFLKNWYSQLNDGYVEIQNIAIKDNQILFTICANSQLGGGLLFSLQTDDSNFSYYPDVLVNNYQINNNAIVFFGSIKKGQTVQRGLFKYNLNNKTIEQMNIHNEGVYVSNSYCYYWENEQEYVHLKRLNLKTKNIESL